MDDVVYWRDFERITELLGFSHVACQLVEHKKICADVTYCEFLGKDTAATIIAMAWLLTKVLNKLDRENN